MTKTGECYYLDDDGSLWLAVSYVNDDGSVMTQSILIQEANCENFNEFFTIV
jgi:hypothetical protein